MQKSDIRIKHSFEEYSDLITLIRRLVKIILIELRTEVSEQKDIMLLYALAKASTQIESILQLWKLKHYSDCWILYRTQVERLLTYHYLIDSNTIKEFDEWSFIQNYETRNKAKSDIKQNPFLIKAFWIENRKRVERYQRLKSENVIWKRPNSDDLEKVARKHNMLDLFWYGYKNASSFVHPLSTEGADEFALVTGLNPRSNDDFDSTPIIYNSLVVLIQIVRLALNETNFEWNEYVFKVIEGCEDFLRDGNQDYKEYMKVVESMINIKFKIFKKISI
jgi:hypothetical protein